MLHLGSLSQTAEWIDWLQLVRLLHGMMVRSLVVAMCLIVGVEDDIGQVTLHSVNNTAMQLSDVFLLDYNEDKDPILGRMMVSMKYDEDVLVDHNGSIKSVGARSSSCNQPSQCCLFSCSSNIKCFFTISFVSTTATKFPFLRSCGNFLLMKNPKLKAQAFAVFQFQCKRKTIMSGAG